MKWLWLNVLIVMLLSCVTLQAQTVGGLLTTDSQPYSTGHLSVTWSRGTSPNSAQPTHLNVKCGTATGQYTLPVKQIQIPATPAAPPDYLIKLTDLVPPVPTPPPPIPQKYFCVSVGAQGMVESKNVSAEYAFFVTGEEIAAPTNLRLVP
jgi:hypothetical protein